MADDADEKRGSGIDERLARRAAKSAERLARKADNPRLGAGKKAGLMAGVAGLSAAGTVAGVSAARAFRHKQCIEDAYAGEDFDSARCRPRLRGHHTGRRAAGRQRGRPGRPRR